MCRGFLLCLLSFHNQVGQVQRLNKLIKCVTCSHIKTDKKNCPAITKHVLLCNIVLQRYSFFVLLKKSKSDALHIRIFFTIFELRPLLLSCVSPVLQNALPGINYAWFQVPIPGSGSCIAVYIVVSRHCFLVVAGKERLSGSQSLSNLLYLKICSGPSTP